MSQLLPSSVFPTPNLTDPQLTLRAICTGMLIGALLTPCNVYTGLKIGWSFNMSISAALLGFVFWKTMEWTTNTPPLGPLENNINQTTASSAASIISSGLVAPIPALAMITGEQLPWAILSLWIFSVSLLGIAVAMGLRHQMLFRDRLSFPAGLATAETVKEIYGKGGEALTRVKVLMGTGLLAAGMKIVNDVIVSLPRVGIEWIFPARGLLKFTGVPSPTLHNLGFVFDPSFLMIGFGAIVGLRTGISLLCGSFLGWAVIGPWALSKGWIEYGSLASQEFWFGPLVEWLLWPGVTLMVTASLTSFGWSLRSIANMGFLSSGVNRIDHERRNPWEIPRNWFLLSLGGSLIIAILTQITIFNISVSAAIIAVALTFALALVAGRVSGETGITPIGAMGKVTQITLGFLVPNNVTTNLMGANVTGGAAGQCADLLHDLKTGLLLGASPRLQAIAQVFGVLTGSLVGSAVYLFLIPHPQKMLLTEEWPAPAVATWKAVAEVFQEGLRAIPDGSLEAMFIAGVAGVGLVLLTKMLPPNIARWLPSASTMGLGFIIPAWNSISLFLGALLGFMLIKFTKTWADRFLMALAAGLVAGESLAGVGSTTARWLLN